jgi:photosystem II stability/assembly factor-like uncharacterized protein
MRVRSFSIRPLVAGFALLLTAFPAVTPLAAQSAPDPAAYETLRWRNIGPEGNRFSAAAGIPGQPYTYYVGAASGGIYKTTDGGVNWDEMFDDQPVQSIGSLAVSPTDPNIVWTGTGEGKIRSHVSIGQGVYKSTDAGETWTLMGLEPTGRIPRLVIHPTNPDIVYVCALGHSYGPQPERGVYRTMDGGESWEHVLFIDEDTGCSDIAMDPTNPRVLFAGTWQLEIHTWGRTSGGPGGGLHVSRDGGDTWEKLNGPDNTIGLPKKPVGKVAVAIAPSNTQRVYAMLETGDGIPWDGQPTEDGQLWRSEDGGRTWTLITRNRNAMGRPHYYSRVVISPDDEDEAYFLTASFTVSTDGGRTLDVIPRAQAPGGDHHDMWIDPTNPDRMIVAHDQGLSISINRTKTWFRQRLTNAQMYHVTVDNAVPYNVLGNKQDEPTYRGPSNSRILGVRRINHIPRGMWHHVGGGESGFATPDPVDPNIVWSSASGFGAAGGIVVRYNETTRQFRQVEVWPESTIGWPAETLRYRFQWVFPLTISPHDRNTVYVGSQHVHRTTNGGQSWEEISPDLTSNNKDRQTVSGGLTPDNIGVEYCCVVYAVDESPVEAGVIYAGTNDGLMHVTRDGGANWTDVTANIPGMPEEGVVRNIDASKWEAGKAYMTVEAHQVGNFAPYVYKTEDFGASWEPIVNGVKDSPLSYTRNVREDPARPGLLYLGTENFLYVSFDDGATWQRLANGLPPSPMYWITVQERFKDLVVGTYGRGFWIMDDISPLQQWTDEVEAASVHLFEPRSVYRFHPITAPFSQFDDWSAGENPPYGAPISYWLDDETEGVKVVVKNAAGETIRTMDGSGDAGLNRVWWNLREDQSTEMRLRTPPTGADWVELDEDRSRSAPGGARVAVLAPPGAYQIELQVGDETRQASLEVMKDPHSEGTMEDIAAQTALVRELRDDMDTVAGMVNEIEWLRRQLLDVKSLAEETNQVEAIASAVDGLEGSLIAVEERLIPMAVTGTGQDQIRWPNMLAGRIGYLAGAVQSADFPPTDQMREVHGILRERLSVQQAELQRILETELPEANRSLEGEGVPGVVRVPPGSTGQR